MLTTASALLLHLAACSAPADDSAEGKPAAEFNSGGDAEEESGLVIGDDRATFLPGEETEGTTLTLTWVEPSSLHHANYVLGDVLLSLPVAPEVVFDLHAPDPSLMVEVDPEGHPGVTAAYFVPALHIDTDGDGLPSEGESYLGVGKTWLLYVNGSPSGIEDLPNALRGWNAMEVDLETGIAEATWDLDDLLIMATLWERPNVSLEGTWSEEVPRGTGLVFRSLVEAQGGAVELPVVADQRAESPFRLPARGPPPDDHFADLKPGVPAAIEVGEAYTDVDGDGAFTANDIPLHGVCSEGTPMGLAYLPTVPSLLLAIKLVGIGNPAGWSAVSLEENPRLVSNSVLTGLSVGSDCPVRTY